MNLKDPHIPSPDVPPWIELAEPKDGHWAAHEAWMHTPTGCRLVKLWFLPDVGWGRDRLGYWQWRVISPAGAWRDLKRTEADACFSLLRMADLVVRELIESKHASD